MTTTVIRYLSPEVEAREAGRAAEYNAARRRGRLVKALRDHQFESCCHAGGSGHGCLPCAADFILSGQASAALVAIDAEPPPPYRFQVGQRWVVPIGPAASARVEEIRALLVGVTDLRLRTQRYDIPPVEPVEPCLDALIIGGTVGAALDAEAAVTLRPVGCVDNPGVVVTVEYLLTHGRMG
jgi:hypothetical protein